MRFHILTLFPEMLRGPLEESIMRRAREQGLLEVRLYNIRDYATDRHRIVDDYPYGGGSGMVMKPEPLFAAVDTVREGLGREGEGSAQTPVILLTPQGRVFTQRVAEELASYKELVLLCGHYGGVDERVRQHLATDEISLGDFVLTGGELVALVVVDAVARLVPGVVGDPASIQDDSHTSGLLQHPQYTRPPEFRDWRVPEVLLSGNHGEIARWRRRQALRRTFRRRPELLKHLSLSGEERLFLRSLEGSPPAPAEG